MPSKVTKLRADTAAGTTAEIKEKIHVRSDLLTAPKDRLKTWAKILKMLKQWQVRGLIPSDDEPAPTRAHRKAVIDYENGEYLQKQEAWIRSGRPTRFGAAKSAMDKAEKRKSQFSALILHIKYVTEVPKAAMYVVQEANLLGMEDIPLKTGEPPAPDLNPVRPPPYVTESYPPLQPSIQAPTFEVRSGSLDMKGVPTESTVSQLQNDVKRLTSKADQMIQDNKRIFEFFSCNETSTEYHPQDRLQTPRSFQLIRGSLGAESTPISSSPRRVEFLQMQTRERDSQGQYREQQEYRSSPENEYLAEKQKEQEQAFQRHSSAPHTGTYSDGESEQHTERGHKDSRTKDIAFSMPLIAAKTGGHAYQPWSHRDMESLVAKLPPLSQGGQKWVNDLEKYTVQDYLCLGDVRALLGRIEGRAEARTIDFEARSTNSLDSVPFNTIRARYWAAIRHIYPTTRSLLALTSLKKGTGEDMHSFLKRCENVWEECTGERHDVTPSVVMLWKNAVIKALPHAVQARLGDVVGLDAKTTEEWRQNLVHHDTKYQETQREDDDDTRKLAKRLLKMQLAERDNEVNRNKKL